VTKPTKNEAKTKTSPIVSISAPTRDISCPNRILLFTKAGGQCEFDGCRKYLLENPTTHKEGIFAEVAHIVAFSIKGPRANDGVRPDDINDIKNLMLLCPQCHDEIDKDEAGHPRAVLERYKEEHEKLVRHLVSLMPSARTAVAVFTAPIGGHPVSVPFDHVTEAVAPRYPIKREFETCDLSSLDGERESGEFLKLCMRRADAFVDRLFRQGEAVEKTGHISLFALAPMSLLVYLGSKLSNKVPCDLFQRHRDNERWIWKEDGDVAEYELRLLQDKGPEAPVALRLSLSGPHDPNHLPPDIRDSATIYEITYTNRAPSTTALRRREDLEQFKLKYQEFIATVLRQHPKAAKIALLPAAPAPVAVLCGRELLPKAHPALDVYDYNKNSKLFEYHLSVNAPKTE
jgi:hypothetical protein